MLNMQLSYDLAILQLGIYPREMKAYIPIETICIYDMHL